MIAHYAGLADFVIVYVSSPRKSGSRRSLDCVDLSPEASRAILKTFLAASGLDNVVIRVSEDPSPVRQIAADLRKLTGCRIIIGTSDKGGDSSRYGWLVSRSRPDLSVADPEKTAFKAEEDLSSSDIRGGGFDFEKYRGCLPSFLSEKEVNSVRRILYHGDDGEKR